MGLSWTYIGWYKQATAEQQRQRKEKQEGHWHSIVSSYTTLQKLKGMEEMVKAKLSMLKKSS